MRGLCFVVLAGLILMPAAHAADQTVSAPQASDPLNRFDGKTYWEALGACHVSASIGMFTINQANKPEVAARQKLIDDLNDRGVARLVADRKLGKPAAQKYFDDHAPQTMMTGFLAPCQALLAAYDAKFGATK